MFDGSTSCFVINDPSVLKNSSLRVPRGGSTPEPSGVTCHPKLWNVDFVCTSDFVQFERVVFVFRDYPSKRHVIITVAVIFVTPCINIVVILLVPSELRHIQKRFNMRHSSVVDQTVDGSHAQNLIIRRVPIAHVHLKLGQVSAGFGR